MRHLRPSPAMVVAFLALTISLTSGVYAAVRVTTRDIVNGAVTHPKLSRNSVWHRNIGTRSVRTINLNNGAVRHRQLARNSVWHANIGTGSVQRNNVSPQLLSELKGATGPAGPAGPPGANGANPALAVLNVPTVTAGETGAGGIQSGQAGDQGFYFTGLDADGPARLAGGQLVLHGVGISLPAPNCPPPDVCTPPQGAIGIGKAFDSVPLGDLDALSYVWHVNTLDRAQAPTIHVTVTGLNADSNFASGFANLVYAPAENGVTESNLTRGARFQSDGFAADARWFSTGGSGQRGPLSAFVARNPNAVIHQIVLDNGGTSSNTGDSFEAGADDLILGFKGSRFTRYDFDG